MMEGKRRPAWQYCLYFSVWATVAVTLLLIFALPGPRLAVMTAVEKVQIYAAKALDEIRPPSTPTVEYARPYHPLADHAAENEEDVDLPDLAALCQNTDFTPGLWLHCHSECNANKLAICGGLSNARSRVQSCVRLAIDAGATGILLPHVMSRDSQHPVDTNHVPRCPDYWFDVEKLERRLNRACPMIKAVTRCNEEEFADQATVVDMTGRFYAAAPHTRGTFRKLADEDMLRYNLERDNVSEEKPVLLRYHDTFIAFDWAATKPVELSTIRKDVTKTLGYNATYGHLAAEILHHLELVIGTPFNPSTSPDGRDNFIAVHLRGEGDWPAGFGTAETQMQAYTDELAKMVAALPSGPDAALPHVYVSCGDRGAVQKFRTMINQRMALQVHDKWTLLEEGAPELLAQLGGMGFDANAAVEFEIMIRARWFMGIYMSTMSLLVAYMRTMDGDWRPVGAKVEGGHEVSSDFFQNLIFPGSSKAGMERKWGENMVLKGEEYTKLMVVSGFDVMDQFP